MEGNTTYYGWGGRRGTRPIMDGVNGGEHGLVMGWTEGNTAWLWGGRRGTRLDYGVDGGEHGLVMDGVDGGGHGLIMDGVDGGEHALLHDINKYLYNTCIYKT